MKHIFNERNFHMLRTARKEALMSGFIPRRPSRVSPRLVEAASRSTGPETTVVVRQGDSLWHIAAAHIGPHATDWEIACEWPRWHAANRESIGPDAAVLPAGLELAPPPATYPARSAPATPDLPIHH